MIRYDPRNLLPDLKKPKPKNMSTWIRYASFMSLFGMLGVLSSALVGEGALGLVLNGLPPLTYWYAAFSIWQEGGTEDWRFFRRAAVLSGMAVLFAMLAAIAPGRNPVPKTGQDWLLTISSSMLGHVSVQALLAAMCYPLERSSRKR